MFAILNLMGRGSWPTHSGLWVTIRWSVVRVNSHDPLPAMVSLH